MLTFEQEGFAIVHYQLFSIPAPNDLGATGPSIVPGSPVIPNATDDNLNIFYKVESKLRERGILVHVDVEEQELWLFYPSSQESSCKPAAGQKAERYMLETCGVSLQCVCPRSVVNRSTNDVTLAGVFTSEIDASTLLDLPPAAAPAAVSTNPSLGGVKDINKQVWEANASLGQPAEGKAPHSHMPLSMDDNEFSSIDIYELLISAVLAMFSYHLARYHDYLPLNARTFLSPAVLMSISHDFSDFDEPSEQPERSTLITLDVRLTDIGTLIIISSVASSGITRLQSRFRDDNSWLQPARTELRLSPGGHIAKSRGPPASDTDNMPVESTPRSEAPDVDVPPRETLLEDTWKLRVEGWLAAKGIYLSDPTPWSWVTVLTASDLPPVAENGLLSQQKDRSDELHILWPRELCYTLDNTQIDCLDTGADRPQVSDEDSGMHDPLSFAEGWFKSKPLRDDQLEAARSTRQNDELLARQSNASETAILDDNSMDEPYIRVVNYLDLHAAGTIYPTPPDGAHTQGGTGAHISNEIGSTPGNGDVGHFYRSASLGANNEHEVARSIQVDGEIYESAERRRSDASQIAMLSAAYDASNADMFGDMDGDMFGTSGITEADFSFFDEPDLMDARDQITNANDPTDHAGPSSQVDLATHSALEGPVGKFPNSSHSDPGPHDTFSGPTPSISMDTFEHNANDTTHKYPMDQEAPLSIEDDIELNPGTPVITNSAGERTGEVGDPSFLSPLLSPVSVRNKLLPALNDSIVTQAGSQLAVSHEESRHCTDGAKSHEGVFGRVSFAGAVESSDRKYSDYGRFASTLQEDVAHQGSRSRMSDIPSIGFPSSTRKQSQASGVDCVSNPSVQGEDTALDSDLVSESEEGKTESVSGPQVSTTDDTDHNASGEDTSVIAGVKRKRVPSDGENAPVEVAPPETIRQPPIYENDAQIQLPSLSRFLPSASASPLARSEPHTGKDMRKSVGLSDDDYIRVAQILTDQVVSSSLSCYGRVSTPKNGISHSPTALAVKEEHGTFGEVVESIFPTSSLCDLETYAAMEETSWESPTNVRILNRQPRWAKTGGDGSGGLGCRITRLNAPHIRVQRAEMPLEVLPPALQFWETLGFGPVNGIKDVRAFCICPPMQGLEDAVDSFLEGLGSAYESCKLGSHTRGDYPENHSPGLIPMAGGEANPSLDSTMKRIAAACEKLGKCTSHVVCNRLTPT